MSKLAYIALGFLVGLPTLLWPVSFYRPTPDNYRRGSYPYYLADFDKRVEAYRRSSTHMSQSVLVGPSYAVSLGEFGSVYNLGSIGATQCEIAAIIKSHCRNSDHIFYALTVWNFMLDSTLVRRQSTSKAYRRLFLLKEQVTPSRIIPGRPWSALYFNSIKFSEEEFESVLEALRAAGKTNSLATTGVLIKRIKHYESMVKRAFHENWKPNLTPYHHLYKEFPNLVFVIFPSVPLAPISPADSDLALTINTLIDAKGALHSAVENSGLPYLDLSEPELLSDMFHSTPEGIEILRERLLQISEDSAAERTASL